MHTFSFSSRSLIGSKVNYQIHVYDNIITAEEDTILEPTSLLGIQPYDRIKYPYIFDIKGMVIPEEAIGISFGRHDNNNLEIYIKDSVGNTFTCKCGPSIFLTQIEELPYFWPLLISHICKIIFPVIIEKMINQIQVNIPFKIGNVLIESTGINYVKEFLWTKRNELVRWKEVSLEQRNGYIIGTKDQKEIFRLDGLKHENSVVLPDFVDFMSRQFL